jgi:hypothetical protein
MRAVLALALCVGCEAETGKVDAALPGDATEVDAPASDARIPTCAGATFDMSAPINVLNTVDREVYLRLSPDELTGYFSRGNPEAPFVTTRPSVTAPFATPVPLTITGNGAAETVAISVTADALTMYFTSDRAGTLGGRDIWRATRAATSTNFGAITAMTALNSTAVENDVFVLPDGSAVYFTSSRDGVSKIYRAARNGSGFDAPVEVLSDNAMTTNRVVVAPNELTMLYSAVDELRLSTRASTSAVWLPGVAMAAIDSANSDFPNWISTDLCRLYYGSDRTGNYELRIAVRAPQ